MGPERKIRDVVDLCAGCDVCRHLMDSTCDFFPEMYRLIDREMDTGEKITSDELRNLVDLCNFCALCPCNNVRADVLAAKAEFIDREGLKLIVRALEDVEPIGKFCGAVPRLANLLLQGKITGSIIKAAGGIHKERKLPEFPQESFPTWAKKHKLNIKPKKKQKRRVAYFAGCSGKFFFPDVPKAVVEVFQHNHIEVYYLDQKCCGIPPLLEGDRKLTLRFTGYNVDRLLEAVEGGYDIVCSCPTCGFMLKTVLKEGAYYSPEYQASVGADALYLKIPTKLYSTRSGERAFILLQKSIYGNLLKDDGYFSSISALKRIKVAENTFDLGEYLRDLYQKGELETTLGPVQARTAYYPPCHLREQNIGRPYLELLGLIPRVSIIPVESPFYCCGVAGIMGFKHEFHKASIKMGSDLMEKITKIHPERLITDCLSCRLQFNQLIPYRVFHPIEILKESYAAYSG